MSYLPAPCSIGSRLLPGDKPGRPAAGRLDDSRDGCSEETVRVSGSLRSHYYVSRLLCFVGLSQRYTNLDSSIIFMINMGFGLTQAAQKINPATGGKWPDIPWVVQYQIGLETGLLHSPGGALPLLYVL